MMVTRPVDADGYLTMLTFCDINVARMFCAGLVQPYCY